MQAIVFMAGFAAAWWVAGIALGHEPLGLAAIGPAISAVFILAAARGLPKAELDAGERKRRGRTVAWIGAVEGAAIAVAIRLLPGLGLADLVFPAVAMIVGLHFVPLARLLPMRIYYLSAVLLVLVAVAGLFAPPADRPFVVGAAAAITLWLTCLVRLVKPTRSVA